MSLRLMLVVLVLVGCGGGSSKDADEPQTAREKQRREAKAAGELDKPNKKWGKWRYTGDRDDCFYVVAGGKCFKSENKACQAARCKLPKKCTSTGAGPATISCK